MITTQRPVSRGPRLVLAAAVAAWLWVFGGLLLTTGLPRVPLVDNGDLSTLGHLGGAFLLALQLALLLPDHWSARRAVGLALAISLAFVGGVEILQELRPVRAYELRDAVADVIGVVAGATVGLAILRRPLQTRQRSRLVVAMMTVGAAALGALVVAAAEVVDRVPR